ncbi:hypothetical protein DV735_g5023, partial [Chaetothyriales sp. CBS 134920]
MDTVILRELRYDLVVGLDAWQRPGKPQPVVLTITIQPSSSFEAAALQDDVSLTLDYGKLYKKVDARVKDRQYANVQALMLDLASAIDSNSYRLLSVDIVLPKALLRVRDGLAYRLRIDRSSSPSATNTVDAATWSLTINKITCVCIVGVNPHERQHKQTLFLDLALSANQVLDPSIDVTAVSDAELHDMVAKLVDRVEGSSYLTLEALATAVAQLVTVEHGHSTVSVTVEKPNAIATIGASVIQITRSRSFFEDNKDFWKVKQA